MRIGAVCGKYSGGHMNAYFSVSICWLQYEIRVISIIHS